jgi:adenosylhomocysteine nucleosidase
MTAEGHGVDERSCSLLLFVATPTEEQALEREAKALDLPFKKCRDDLLGEYHWLGAVGNESVIAIRPAREGGSVVMGAIGRLGSAARAIRFQQATGAQAIVQIGMAFGVNPAKQLLGDVVVSSSLIPYDNRDVNPAPRNLLDRILGLPERDIVSYGRASRQPARAALMELFKREAISREYSFKIHIGAMLSGAARIGSERFRRELVACVPGGEDEIIGGEMEGVGLLSASVDRDDPAWCVVKGISDFADSNRDRSIEEYRRVACQNAARFVLSAIASDAARKSMGGSDADAQ